MRSKFFLSRAYRQASKQPTKDVQVRIVRSRAVLPHERDESVDPADAHPRDVMVRAKRDIDAGLVDTDSRAKPGLDAEQRRRILRRKEP
jgi:hypothetical protein